MDRILDATSFNDEVYEESLNEEDSSALDVARSRYNWLVAMPLVLTYLPFESMLRMSCVCRGWRDVLKAYRKRELRHKGVPKGMMRWRYWSHCVGVATLLRPGPEEAPRAALELKDASSKSEKLTATDVDAVFEFRRCLGNRRGRDALQTTGIEGEILRDVSRTFQRDAFFRDDGVGQDGLADVLRAVATYAPGVNYCQGMNYVAAILLLEATKLTSPHLGATHKVLPYVIQRTHPANHGEYATTSPRSTSPRAASNRQSSNLTEPIQNETSTTKTELAAARAFSILAAMVCNLDMRDLWRPGVPQLKLRIFQFDKLIQRLQPALFAHFRAVGLSPDFFASQWFLTLLSINLPLELLVRVWDVLLTDGWKTVFRVGLYLLKSSESKLLQMSLEDLGLFFKAPSGAPSSFVTNLFQARTEWLSEALSQKGVSTKILIELEGLYVSHVLSQQLSKDPADIHGAVAFVDRRVAVLVRDEISRLDGPVRADVKILRTRIEATERALSVARDVFLHEAREFIEVQADMEELEEAKQAIMSQLDVLMSQVKQREEADAESKQTSRPEELEEHLREDANVLRLKIATIDSQLERESARFGGVLWRTSQAQVDLEEALERKSVFSEQLRLVVERNETSRSARMKALFKELNVEEDPVAATVKLKSTSANSPY